MRFPKTALALAAAADIAVALAAAPAYANAPRQVRVSYADLDLSAASDRRVLRDRLGQAASRLCGDEHRIDMIAACRRDVLDNVAQSAMALGGEAR